MNNSIYKRGFTMIELLVVIGIIGILSTVLFLGATEAREDAWNKKIKAELQNVQVALELYKADEGEYPVPQTNGNAWCQGDIIDYTIKYAISGENGSSLLAAGGIPLGTPFCQQKPIVGDHFVPEYIASLPGQADNVPDNCHFVYITTTTGDAYKFSALGCYKGAGNDSSKGVQPDDELARCPSGCTLCGTSVDPTNRPAYDPSLSGFYNSYAVYSDGGQCW
jgi:prepilin-type N-terminal cleavage/methylation domain-containing protein